MDLSVIILSFNTKDITDECLRRLQVAGNRLQKIGSKLEVIVLDNASSDGSVEMIENRHSSFKLIKSKNNTGYSGGNNIGLKKSTKPYILLLNSDAFIEEDTLVKALEYFQNHPYCDVLGGKLVYENGTLQPSAGNLPTPLNTIFWILGIGQIANPFHPKNPQFFSKDREVGWVMGAFFMFKRTVYENVGGFDEDIFMYMDEVDICKRISNAHFKVCFTPSLVITHLQKASSKDFPEKALTNELKGIKVYFKKHYSGSYLLVRLFLILGLILRIIAFSFLGKTKRARAYVEGLSVI